MLISSSFCALAKRTSTISRTANRSDACGEPIRKIESQSGVGFTLPAIEFWRAACCVAYAGQPALHVSSGSIAPFRPSARHFRSTPINGHRQTGPTGPFSAKSDVGVTAVRPGAAEQQRYRNGFEIGDHLSVRSPLLLNDRTSEACCSFAS